MRDGIEMVHGICVSVNQGVGKGDHSFILSIST